MLLEEVRVGVAHVDEFEGVLHCDFVPAGQVVHEELYQIEEVSGFEASLVKDAPLVHEREFVLIDFSIEIFVDFPDPLIHLGLVVGEAQLS